LKIRKAVITAAARGQRQDLPLQRLIDRNGSVTTAIGTLIAEAVHAGAEQVCLVVAPGDEAAFARAAGEHASRVTFAQQSEPLGYGHALYCARAFTAGEPFLHLVGDHVYVGDEAEGETARRVIALAEAQQCSVSGVKATRETQLPLFGAVGGQRVPNTPDTFVVDLAREKPTPTEAEQYLLVPGLRAGYYLCFFGIHVFSAALMEMLGAHVRARLVESPGTPVGLTPVLDDLAGRERYLALEMPVVRCPIDVRYGLFAAQLSLGLAGKDRDEVLALLLDHLARRAARDGGADLAAGFHGMPLAEK
jgi:UTP--glucose-1-phosphate uridylyltransferase